MSKKVPVPEAFVVTSCDPRRGITRYTSGYHTDTSPGTLCIPDAQFGHLSYHKGWYTTMDAAKADVRARLLAKTRQAVLRLEKLVEMASSDFAIQEGKSK